MAHHLLVYKNNRQAQAGCIGAQPAFLGLFHPLL
jgi:hypothetical protein